MSKSLSDSRAEAAFEDFKPPYSEGQAMAEANRCLYCEDAPCIKKCPTEINIPEFIRKISTENVKGSARTIFESNILGMSCARVCPVEVLCVGDCVYNEMGIPPIQIGKLQRYATDMAFEKGWEFFEAGEATGKSVGLIGGGPASIAAAHELRRHGHACTLYEKRGILGGLNTWGVAPYKMKADRALEEIDWALKIGGIEQKLGVAVGEDISWDALKAEHDALVLGFGLGPDRWMEIPGTDLDGVHGAVDFIEDMKLKEMNLSGVKNALVIGAGNTALDAVRELAGLGVPQVTMVYRGQESQMSGYAHEWKVGKIDGATAAWRANPVELKGNGKVQSVVCQRYDKDKKPIDGDTFTLDADLVLFAIGQSKIGDCAEALGIKTEWGKVVVDDNGFTGQAGVYAAGDCANGGKEVVNAVAEGKRVANAINAAFGGGK